MAAAISFVTFMAFAFFCWRRMLRYLHIFQQDEYDASRFLPWLAGKIAFDKKVSFALILLAIFAVLIQNAIFMTWPVDAPESGTTITGLIGLLFATAGLMEPNPLKAAKKKLILTNRAKRILAAGLVLALSAGAIAAVIGGSLIWLAAVHAIPLAMVLGNWLLKPVEASIQKGFQVAAEKRLREVGPKIIGITGSFGKTSVKHILGHVLEMNTTALFTPGSVNTVMGISRIINERLADNCRYFIVEMGAYGIGSIARLCKFTPPDHGILTSIGEAHYERFKDLETVARAKFELAEAVSARGGVMVIDESVLERRYARQFFEQNRAMFMTVGDSESADIQILSIVQTAAGLSVEIRDRKSTHCLFAPLYGIHHGRNMALAYALAASLGLTAERIIQALRTTPQITHRLEVKRHPTGATYIDDAYNANPAGISGGLDLMQSLNKNGGRRIFVTPGVVELGTRHDAVHRELGDKAARTTDITIAVRPDRIATFIEGFKAAGTDSRLLTFTQFSEALIWIDQNLEPSDVILIANDLPDLLERRFVS
ncbi:MAG: UDP-N-acetylmuramoyl-tripeptide--D-alanyl-D-alanine ligase [Pseudomonadota bacterium]